MHRETGQGMEAAEIESSGGPEGMRLRLPDGGTAGLSELEFARPETRTLYRMAESYPTEKARSYVGLYDGETPLRAYTEAFQRMYEAGERGSGYEAAAGRAEEVEGAQAIDPKRLKWMYEAGENRARQRKLEETGKSGGDARQRRENGIAERAERGYNEETDEAGKFNIKEVKLQLKTDPNIAFFWSGKTNGVGGPKVAADIAKGKGGVTLESIIDSKKIVMPEWDFNNPSSMEAWNLASSAYAEQVSGEVRAVIGSELRPGNIWENIEFPRLKSNPNVTKIITIDPKTRTEKIIFERKK